MKRILTILSVLSLIGFAVLAAIIVPGLRSATTSTWDTSSGEPVPDRFLYAMFPTGDGSELAQFVTPRVVLNTHAEVHGDQSTYRIFDASGSEHLIPKSALTFEPPLGETDLYLEALNETIVAWGAETDFRFASLTIERADSVSTVILRVVFRNGTEQESEYEVRSENAAPIRYTLRR